MKKIVVALCVTLASVLAYGQGLNLVSGSAETLLSVGTSTGGFDFDSSGDIVYIGQSGTNSGDTQVIKATKASDYQTQTPIVDYGTTTYGSFVLVNGTGVYYGDSVGANPAGYVNGSNLNVAGPPASPHQIALMPGNYDMAFSGTTAVVSADITGTSNEVYTLNIATGVYKPLLNTGGDYSGPAIFDSAGDLIYGKSGAASIGGGICIFSKAKVDAAIASGTPLTLSDTTSFISNSGNSGFALGPNGELYQSFDPLSGAATLRLYDLNNPGAGGALIGTVDNSGDYFSAIRFYDGSLVVADTDGFSFTDFYQLVPEPGVTWLGLGGLAAVGVATRRRRKRITS